MGVVPDAPPPVVESAPREVRVGDRVTVVTTLHDPAAAAGRPYVLVHGLGMSGDYWRGLATVLARSGPVHALDLPGFGRSPEPGPEDTLDIPSSGDELADVVRQVLAGPGPAGPLPSVEPRSARPVLVGHSMGTQIVVEAVARHPGLTDLVVLVAPTVNVAERTVARQAWRMLQDVLHATPRVWAVGLWSYAKVGPRWFLGKFRTMLGHDVEATLPQVHSRTLVVRGERDRVCPRDWCEHVTRLLPDAELREVPGRGHETMIEQAGPVGALIEELVAHG